MSLTSPEAKAFLFELYHQTGGDVDIHVSMYDVGQALGLDRAEAGAMAEDLYIQGYAELKTLSGGIGITKKGLTALAITMDPEPGESVQLGSEKVLGQTGRQALETLLEAIKETLPKAARPYARLEEMVLDIKTIEVQMLSPSPKTAVIREVLRSLHENFEESGEKTLAAKLKALMSS
jgi:hypothetical protein